MHRFFLTDRPLQVDHAVDLAPLAHQLAKVLRLAVGDPIVLLDNRGNEFDVKLTAVQPKAAAGLVLARRTNRAEPTKPITLYQCSLKADKFEWVLQKGTELGVTTFVPVVSQRSVVRPAAALHKKYGRWQTILREAAEQCGRGRIPQLLAPLELPAALTHATALRLLPWEAEQQTAPLLAGEVIQQQIHAATGVDLLIGPEGGIAAAEASAAQAHGWQTISLGPRILRAETAALASIAQITACCL